MSQNGMRHDPNKPGLPVPFFNLPIIDTPLTRMSENMCTYQRGPCADRELDYVRCARRVGMQRGEFECRKFLQDLHECIHQDKTLLRYEAMKAEREKQGRPYLPAPPADSVKTWFQ